MSHSDEIGVTKLELYKYKKTLISGAAMEIKLPVIHSAAKHGELKIVVRMSGKGVVEPGTEAPFDYAMCGRKAGWLTKRGGFIKVYSCWGVLNDMLLLLLLTRTIVTLVQSWKRRWFVLKGKRLIYYEEGGQKPSNQKGEVQRQAINTLKEQYPLTRGPPHHHHHHSWTLRLPRSTSMPWTATPT